MKLKTISISIMILTIFAFASSSYINSNKKIENIDGKLYNMIINTPIKNLNSTFKLTSKDIIKKLNEKNIKTLDNKQTIIQIALSNAKSSNEIIDILLSH